MTHELSALEERVLSSLRRIIRAIDLHSRELLRRYRLTTPQLTCLRFIRQHGLVNTGEIARGISLGQATLTGILDRLEQRGLLARRRSTVDRRCVLVELTEAGRELVATVPVPLQERFAQRLGKLGTEDRQRIDETLVEIVAMMEASDLDASPLLDTAASLAEAPAETTAAPPLVLVSGQGGGSG
ncbi:MAG: MarR family transcriptional regulator [Thermoanaerobaculia bacterium]|nr:MarR family transcriptional regulator [Thermoanaerobaculia bacterium]